MSICSGPVNTKRTQEKSLSIEVGFQESYPGCPIIFSFVGSTISIFFKSLSETLPQIRNLSDLIG